MKKSFLFTTIIYLAFFILNLPLFMILFQDFGQQFQQQPAQVLGETSKKTGIQISATVGGENFTLYGYSSPLVEVGIDGIGLHYETTADNKGFFEFKDKIAPSAPQETCLSGKDQFGRVTKPVCIPPFPTDERVTVGPVILPPTVSLDKDMYIIGDQVVLSGQTIPNTDVNLSVFTDDKANTQDLLSKILDIQFIRPVEAFSLPELSVQSDGKGNFSVSLPSSSAKAYRIFTRTKYGEDVSPQSLMLHFKILPLWLAIIRMILMLLSFFQRHLFELIILAQIIWLGIYTLRRYFPIHIVVENRKNTLQKHYSPLKREHPLEAMKKRILKKKEE